MKLYKWMLAVCAAVMLAGCINNSGGGDSGSGSSVSDLPEPQGIADGYIRVNYQGSGSKLRLWIWNDFAAGEKERCKEWPNGVEFTNFKDGFMSVDLKLSESPKLISMIVVGTDSKKYTGDSDVNFYFPKRHNEVFLFPNDGTAYISRDKGKAKGVYAAVFTSDMKIKASGSDVTLSAGNVGVKDKDGNAVGVASCSGMEVTLAASVKSAYAAKKPYTLTVKDGGIEDSVEISLEPSLIDTWYGKAAVQEAKESAPGVTVSGAAASFKMWAPLATSVNLLLYKDSASLEKAAKTVAMKAEGSGFWTAADIALEGNKYYQYEVDNGSSKNKVSDIWSYVASADSVASQIATVDDAAATPAGWEGSYTNPWKGEDYRDAVIYEMHIRDWSRAEVADSTGKFLDIANSKKIIGHLKDLGVTHVQILPMFDYAQKNADTKYNWGYNPYHYNVPEGRYVSTGYNDGTQAVSEMRQMIKALHDAGIAVNMDVVYNHTNGTTTGSLYDMTVPEYFYRMSNGSYSNGSGCGNEVATNHAMVKYYVIESLKHWMNDYHINGFRFDLMGLHEKSTMKEIYEALYKIDPKVMVYGEPWTGGTAAVQDGMEGAVETASGYGVGAFDDDFRDAIKGAEFGGFKKGQVQGEFNDDGIKKGLEGASGKRNSTGKEGLALHYVEVHDNYTLFDKLSYSTVDGISGDNLVPKFPTAEAIAAKLNEIKRQDKLAAAYVFLSQGTPLINGGQEFMRTKKGNPDSYAADTKGGVKWTDEAGPRNIDDCNTIDLGFKDKYIDVYNTYKALIKIRKDIDAFRSGMYARAEKADGKNGVTKYETTGSNGTYIVYFNATAADCTLSKPAEGYKFTISETDGTYSVADTAAAISVIPAKGFVILKK